MPLPQELLKEPHATYGMGRLHHRAAGCGWRQVGWMTGSWQNEREQLTSVQILRPLLNNQISESWCRRAVSVPANRLLFAGRVCEASVVSGLVVGATAFSEVCAWASELPHTIVFHRGYCRPLQATELITPERRMVELFCSASSTGCCLWFNRRSW